MRKALILMVLAAALLLLLFHVPTVDVPPVFAQTPDGEHNCPATTAIPPYVGTGTGVFSPNQNLCLPRLAPVGGPMGVVEFIVQGVEPGIRVDSQGTIYEASIRGVPGGVDLWRWYQTADGAPSFNGTLPFKYEGQPDNCGILTNGCANNVNSLTNPGVAPGGGDVDIAVNAPDPLNSNTPNLALTSLLLAPGVTATHSTDRGNTFSAPNVAAALIPGDDRQWNDAIDTSTAYLSYHDVASFDIDVQRSNDGGATYVNGFGEAIDPSTFPLASGVPATNTANTTGQIRIDHSRCPSRGNLYQIFAAPDSVTENVKGTAPRTVYVGVSVDAKLGMFPFMFTDYKIFAGPAGDHNQGAVNLFPALATDNFGFVYTVWSDQTHINFSSSSDHGKTWTVPMAVNSGATVGKSNVFPWVAADANGHVVVVWLGANLSGNSNDRMAMENGGTSAGIPCSDGSNRCWAQWRVYMAETVNGHDPSPGFTQYTASDHVIHAGTVSTGGLGGGANRNLADYFQVALDPQHRANISFADDHVLSPLCQSRTSGHCADPDDAQGYRTGQPYFTYRLHPPAGLNTEGTCAGQATEGEEEDEVEGDDNEGDHVDSVDRRDDQNHKENGTFHYHDSSKSVDVQSSNGVRSITYSGSCVNFIGDAKVNGKLGGYQFTFAACGLSATGGIGTFAITLTGPGGFTYSKNSTMTNGFVKLHVLL
jgi:hypothetical protein